MASPIVILTGPTASGKSAFALSLAQSRQGVIINADSQQLYRNLRILTARPSQADETAAPHRLYGILGAHEPCSAGAWLRLARMEIDWARAEGRTPIVTGGTGLYLKALMEGIADIPGIPEAVRQQAESDYDAMGKEAFVERLRHVDPQFFERLKVYDRQRLVRAYAVWLGSGKSLSGWQQQTPAAFYRPGDFEIYTVDIPRDLLYARCDARVSAMLEHGALEEVRALLALNLPGSLPVMKSVGVREFGACLRGETSLEEATAATQQATRNYAKRQLTWLRGQLPQATPLPFKN